MTDLLLIGATERELAPLADALADARDVAGAWGPARRGRLAGLDVVVAPLGVGKARTAAGLAWALARARPVAVLQVGVGGGYVGSFLSVGLAMLADVELELDLGVATGDGWADVDALRVPLWPTPTPIERRETRTHAGLTAALSEITSVPRGRFATLDAVTADFDVGAALQRRFDVSIESMEGAAAALVAARMGVPFAELRAVSNVVGERDRRRWDLSGAARGASSVAAAAIAGLVDHPTWTALRRDTAEKRPDERVVD